jgi:hypothetical protein
MLNDENVGQQLQSYLPGMAPKAEKPKKPHQMTPEEFAAHPYAVFHSSHVPLNKVNRPYGGGIHAGTEQAALERHVATSSHQNRRVLGINHPDTTSDAQLHTFWHQPTEEQVGTVVGDKAANRGAAAGATYYRNDHEDEGSTSLVTYEPENLKTHGEYVRQAIKTKKGHEVPAKTMEMYRQGDLSKGAWLPRSTSLAHTTPDPDRTSPREDYTSEPAPLNMSHLDHVTQGAMHDSLGPRANWYDDKFPEPRPRVSNNGPDIGRMKAQLEQAASTRSPRA